jgi:hypothetical protein
MDNIRFYYIERPQVVYNQDDINIGTVQRGETFFGVNDNNNIYIVDKNKSEENVKQTKDNYPIYVFKNKYVLEYDIDGKQIPKYNGRNHLNLDMQGGRLRKQRKSYKKKKSRKRRSRKQRKSRNKSHKRRKSHRKRR